MDVSFKQILVKYLLLLALCQYLGLQSKTEVEKLQADKVFSQNGSFRFATLIKFLSSLVSLQKKKKKNPKITAIKTDLLHRFPSFSSDLLQTCIVSCSASMIQSTSLGCGSYVKSATGTASMVCKERKWEGMPCGSQILRLKCSINRIWISELTHPLYYWTESMHESV